MVDFMQKILEITLYIPDLIWSSLQSIFSVIRLLFNIIKDLPLFIKLTTAFSADLPSYLNWLPSSVVSIITLTVGIVIVYKFFGRT